ncbi:hypothetical protein FA95DRAFT_1464814, partial [Auriscalpium vulgare]
DKFPEYLEGDYDYLKVACSGAEWDNIVMNWRRLEARLDIPSELATKYRPTQIKQWTDRHRQYNKPPATGRGKEFAAIWRKWWISLQPSWRGVTWPLARPTDAPAEGWGELLKGGHNGFVMILFTLAWWLSSVKTNTEQNEWASAVEDVDW